MKKISVLLLVGFLSSSFLLSGCSNKDDQKTASSLSDTGDEIEESNFQNDSGQDPSNVLEDLSTGEIAMERETIMSYPGQISVDLNAPKTIDTDPSTIRAGREAALTADTYTSITIGMSYDEVVAIMGTEGETLTETDENGIKSEMCVWVSIDTSMYATFTFVNGHVSGKMQTGVFGIPDAKIDRIKYDQIQEGNTYADLISIIGGEGQLAAESEIDGLLSQTYVWYTEDGFGHASVTISEGVVVLKRELGIIPLLN